MISVCIAMHNGGDFIIEELNSILPQLSGSDEVVISDDGSTDGSIERVEELNDDRIKIYPYKCEESVTMPRLFVTRNFENALLHAKGDIVLWQTKMIFGYPRRFRLVLNNYSIMILF